MNHGTLSRISWAALVVASASILGACGTAPSRTEDPGSPPTPAEGSQDPVVGSETGPSGIAAEGAAQATDERVLFKFEGDFDGTDFHIRPVSTPVIPGDPLIHAADGEEVGVSKQTLLATVTSGSFGTGTDGTGTSIIALEQMATAMTVPAGTGPAWDTSVCGTVGGSYNVGSCAHIRMRNLFTDQDISRAYVRLTALTPNTSKGTTAVTVPTSGVDNQTSAADADFVTAGAGNGTWRYGLVGFNSPLTNGPDRYWAFHGTSNATPAKLNFSFGAEVVGNLMRPTIRASTRDATMDKSPFYTSNGTVANNISGTQGLQMSGNGQYVAFSSNASNLQASANTTLQRVFRKDLTTGAVVVVSVTDTGALPASCVSNWPSISDDGRFVVFQSTCPLVSTVTSSPVGQQIYVRDITSGTTTLVSADATNPTTTAGNNSSSFPRISGNGGYIAFQSYATNLLPPGQRPANRPAYQDMYRYAVATKTIQRANVPNGQDPANPNANWPNQAQMNADISSDGRYMVYETLATNLWSGANSWFNYEIALYDFQGTVATHAYRMSALSSGGEPAKTTSCVRPSISPDATAVSFLCTLGTGDPAFVASPVATAGRQHVYVRDATPSANSSIRMVDRSTDGTTEGSAAAATIAPALSGTGRFVGYVSGSSNLLRSTGCSPACAPATSVQQMYVFDRLAADITLSRNFGVSLIRKKVAGTPNSVLLASGSTSGAGRVSLAGFVGGVFAAYPAVSVGTDWNQIPSGNSQVFISPVGDPQFE